MIKMYIKLCYNIANIEKFSFGSLISVYKHFESVEEVSGMDIIDVNAIKKNDTLKVINPDNTLIDGQVIEVANDFLGIRINTIQNAYCELRVRQIIELILVCGSEAVKCSSTILGSKLTGIEQFIIVSMPNIILKIQRREFQRVPIVMDLEYSPLPEGVEYKKLNNVESKYYRYFKKTYTVDISAGGVSFIVPKDEVDSNCSLVNLSIKEEKIIILGRKIRIDAINDSRHNKIAFVYEDIEKHHRQMIYDFVAEKCRENDKLQKIV